MSVLFYSIFLYMEKIVQSQVCHLCNISFDITDRDLEFYKKVSPVFGWKKYSVPTPNLCPECRNQRRLLFRNETNLYRRKCNKTNKNIISIYSPDKPYIVYWVEDWVSDDWDPLSYWVDIDLHTSFLDQFDTLLKKVPRIASFQFHNENSEFTNWAQRNKNCYMVFVSDHNEDCMYTNGTYYSQDCIDCLSANKSINCYQCVDIDSSYDCSYSQNLVSCRDVHFSKDCSDCTNCYGCSWLKNKNYCINNQQYTKEEYQKKIQKDLIPNKSSSDIKLYYNGFNISNSSGDFIKNLRNSNNCFESQDLEDCKHITYGINIKNCHDGYVVVDNSENCYETISTISNYNSLFVYCSWNNNRAYYIDSCQDSQDIFLCMGLKNKSYCILNKQYTKEEYETLVPKIIEKMKSDWEWGEFFPSSMSPFGYNETVANEYFPLTKEQAIKKGFNWSDYEAPFPKVEKIIPAEKLPTNITDIPDDILNWAIECEVTGKPFRIIKSELEFYRKHSLSIPKRHPSQRHLDRMSLRNSRKLYERKCDKCDKDIQTTYAPERKETVYCQDCYDKTIY